MSPTGVLRCCDGMYDVQAFAHINVYNAELNAPVGVAVGGGPRLLATVYCRSCVYKAVVFNIAVRNILRLLLDPRCHRKVVKPTAGFVPFVYIATLQPIAGRNPQ
jgi:hypothetical protein